MQVVVGYAQLLVVGRKQSVLQVIGEMVNRRRRIRDSSRLLFFFQSSSRLARSATKSSRVGDAFRRRLALADDTWCSVRCSHCGLPWCLIFCCVSGQTVPTDAAAFQADVKRIWDEFRRIEKSREYGNLESGSGGRRPGRERQT